MHQKRISPADGGLALHARTGVPNLGYMYPFGYICLSQGVHYIYCTVI